MGRAEKGAAEERPGIAGRDHSRRVPAPRNILRFGPTCYHIQGADGPIFGVVVRRYGRYRRI